MGFEKKGDAFFIGFRIAFVAFQVIGAGNDPKFFGIARSGE